MPAALVTLIQTALLQQQKLAPSSDDSKTSDAGEKALARPRTKDRADVLAIGRQAPDSAAASASKEMVSGNFATLLQEVITTAQELARTDSMLIEARANAPKDEEAQKWHEVSLRALVWSRETLAERQVAAIASMKTALERPATLPIKGFLEPAPECLPMRALKEPIDTSAAPQQDTSLVGSLRADLEKLRTYDPDRCLLVRNLKKLGLRSQQLLQEHFGHYGVVSEVLVAHSFEKPSAKRRNGRIRSATKGFVVMEDPAVALRVLQDGETQWVADGEKQCELIVERFNPRAADAYEEADDES